MTRIFTDTGYYQKAKHGQNSFGDVIAKKIVREENRRIIVLSDGMGSGIKANVLASLTSSMAINFTEAHKNIAQASELIMNILPECSERKISYSTFTIFDLKNDGTMNMIVYDGPLPALIRNGSESNIEWNSIGLDGKHKGKTVYTAEFRPELNDRIFAFTDGVTQSGLGTGKGEWGRSAAVSYLAGVISEDPDIPASLIAEKLVNKAEVNDRSALKDDASVVSLYFREPRELLICTGAPSLKEKDFSFAEEFASFKGRRIIAGGTTSEIIARELDLRFAPDMIMLDDGLPPISKLESVDLVTEGVITLTKAEKLLRTSGLEKPEKDGAAERMVKLILDSDRIHFLVGASSNEFHFGLQYKMRVQLVKDITETLETIHFKDTSINFF